MAGAGAIGTVVDVRVLHVRDCPNVAVVGGRLRELAVEMDLDTTYQLVDRPELAAAIGFRGSPTVLVDGVDAFPDGDDPPSLSCRIYDTPDGPAGAPTIDQLREALTR